MTNEELAAHLNGEATLGGREAITANVIRQWVGWDVLPKARIAGRSGPRPKWARSDEAVARAMRLAQLRKAGVRRENAVIAQAYLEWGHPDFDRAKSAILYEFRKWRKKLHSRQTTYVGNQAFSNLSAVKSRAIANQFGPLGKQFVSTRFQQSPELYALLGGISREAVGDVKRAANLFADALKQIAPGAEAQISRNQIDRLIEGLIGFTGSPDEIANSGELEIEKASKSQFEAARNLSNKQIYVISLANHFADFPGNSSESAELFEALNSNLPQITTGPGRLFHFSQILICQIRRPHWEFDAAEIDRNS